MIDPALLRPGRFDKIVFVPMPDKAARHRILDIHSKDKPIGPDVDLAKVAELTESFSGADASSVANTAVSSRYFMSSYKNIVVQKMLLNMLQRQVLL